MIREDEIREFQEIIGGRNQDSETRNCEKEQEYFEVVEDAPEGEIKTDNPSPIILFITGILGLAFVASVFLGAIMYIYLEHGGSEQAKTNYTKPSQSLKIPGIEFLVTDPHPDEYGKRIKVWCVRTAVPPTPQIGDYYSLFSNDSDDYLV